MEDSLVPKMEQISKEEAILVHPNVKHHCESSCDRCALESCVASLDQLFLKTDDSRKYNGPMPHRIEILIQLASGLEHIHSKNLIHGDIKPENVLIFVEPTGQEKITLKWTNFGLTRKVHENGKKLTSEVERNNVWLAPELLKLGSNGQENEYQGTVQSDVFALGLVFGSLLLKGEHLYGSMENENEISGNIIEKNPINMQKMDRTLRDCYEDRIFKKMLEYDPNKRMTSTEVVNQLKSINDKLNGKEEGTILYDSTAVLGRGSYGSVFKGTYAGREVAVKRVELHLVNEREEEAMKILNHSNIVKLFHSASDVHFRVYALELCDASLDQLFLKSNHPKKYNGPMPRPFEVLVQLALGLEHIHSKDLSHRDIKPNNVLISKTTTNQGVEVTIKLADFGLSKPVSEQGTFSVSGIRGNRKWLAPETLRQILQADNGERGNVKSDVFALGLVFGYYFLKGEHLYGSSEKEIHDNIIGKKPINMEKMDHPLRDCYEDKIFKKILEYDPNKRMTSTEVVNQLKSIKDKLNGKEEGTILYDRTALLGTRSYGSVFKGTYAGREVAVKRVELHKVNIREEEAMKILNHSNIVKLFHSARDVNFRMYALELCDASLDQLFLKSNDPKKYNGPMPRHFEVLVQLALGLEHIHSKKLIHRDIKPNNVLISTTTTSQGVEVTIKWAVFGLSKQVNEGETFLWSTFRGNIPWLSPETLRQRLRADYGEPGNVKSNVFALGLVFGYIFLKGRHLYGFREQQVQNNIIEKKPINMKKIDDELREIYEDDLFKKMLEDDPSKRMTSKEVVLQLESIEEKLAEKEDELRDLCARGYHSDLTEKIKKMIRYGIDLNAKDEDGFNALHLLCKNNSSRHLVDAIKVLIELGIDKDAKDEDESTALHLLCENNTNQRLVDAIKVLIELDIDKDAKGKDGWTALHFLCRFNLSEHLIEAIEVLIELGIDKDAKDKDESTALHLLCAYNSSQHLIEAIEVLIELGIDKNSKSKNGWNALHFLCANNSSQRLVEAIKVLIELGIAKDAKANYGRTALHLLCTNKSSEHLVDAIKVLIELGIDKDAKDEDGWTALHFLCSNDSSQHLVEAIKVLIKLGIDKDAKDEDESTALHLLCGFNLSQHLVDAIKVLIELGIAKDAKEKNGWNALHVLCAYNSSQLLVDAIKVLIELGIDKNSKTKNGWSALHVLCTNNSSQHLIEAIKVLIKLGIDKDARTNDGWTALHVLCTNNSSQHLIEAIKVLIELGIDVNAKTNHGGNALHIFCQYASNLTLVKGINLLVRFGIDKNVKDNDGSNALHCLCANESTSELTEAMKLLIELGIDVNAKTNSGRTALDLLPSDSNDVSQYLKNAIHTSSV